MPLSPEDVFKNVASRNANLESERKRAVAAVSEVIDEHLLNVLSIVHGQAFRFRLSDLQDAVLRKDDFFDLDRIDEDVVRMLVTKYKAVGWSASYEMGGFFILRAPEDPIRCGG